MACMLKRPCRLNLALAMGMDCGGGGGGGGGAAPMHGSSTPAPRRHTCEKRSSPDSSTVFGVFSAKESALGSPNAIRPAADTLFRRAMEAQLESDEEHQVPALPNASTCQKRRRRARRGRGLTVSFSGCSKSHDGLRPASRILDALMYAYFETQCISGREDVRTLILERFGGDGFATPSVLHEVLEKLTTLCERVMDLDDFCSMPVLIEGGGRGLQLQAVHCPHLRHLTKLFEQFVTGPSEFECESD